MSITLKKLITRPPPSPPLMSNLVKDPEMEEEFDYDASSSEDDQPTIGRKRKGKRKKRESPRKKQKVNYLDDPYKKVIDEVTINDLRHVVSSHFYDRALDGDTTDATEVEL